MNGDAWLSLGVAGLILVALIRNLGPPGFIFLGGAVLLTLLGVITPEQTFSGFANPAVWLLGALFVVTAALRETGVLDYVGHKMLGQVRTELRAIGHLAGVVIPLSAVVNNTPVVAMLVPTVIDWCRHRGISPSRLLMPLSFLAIVGGTCTLIGTSTNVVVHGLMLRDNMPEALNQGMGFFEIGAVGLPSAIIATLYIMFVGRRLLPDRKELMEQLGETRREYLVEMLVQPDCRLVDQTVEDAGLRQLQGLFLLEIDRNDTIIAPVTPKTLIRANDRLVFTGVVSTIVELERIPGLVPAADAAYEVAPKRQQGRRLCEAVISPSSPLIGKTVKNADFRALYNAAVVAVHRNGARITSKIGDINLQTGDTLLLQTGDLFLRSHRNNPDFYLVSDVEGSRPLRTDRAGVAVALFAALVLLMITGWVDPAIAALLVGGLMIAARCVSPSGARQSVDLQVLLTIGSAFAVGLALEESGAASAIAGGVINSISALGPVAVLAALYFGTVVLTQMITNVGAAVLVFPFCVEAASIMGVDPRPFVMALALAASSSFASPIGYQTNLMVYGPGGYRFTDFVRMGLPLNLILWALAVVLIPLVWPF